MKNLIFAIFFGLMVVGCTPEQEYPDHYQTLYFHGIAPTTNLVLIDFVDCDVEKIPPIQVLWAYNERDAKEYLPLDKVNIRFFEDNSCQFQVELTANSYYWISIMIERDPPTEVVN